MKQRLMRIAWPAFLVAAALEMGVFALVDPEQLHGPTGEPLGLTRNAVYAIAFFGFWAAAMASSALTSLLCIDPSKPKTERNGAKT